MLSPASCAKLWPGAQLPLPRAQSSPANVTLMAPADMNEPVADFHPVAGRQGVYVATKSPGALVQCSSSRRYSRIPHPLVFLIVPIRTVLASGKHWLFFFPFFFTFLFGKVSFGRKMGTWLLWQRWVCGAPQQLMPH